ncbi:MAG TPA: LysE family translocator [Bellilinea sp.]|nr:LysE family translocator [Bellilinea sp.]
MNTLSFNQLLPFVLFAFVASITPGPTNLLILGGAVRHGLLAVLPLVLGAAVGAAGLLLVVALGLGEMLLHYPLLQNGMALVGVAWISWLGWKLFNAPASGIEVETSGNCPGAIHGAGLQLINPKTWMMALSVVSVFVGAGSGPATYGLYAAIFLLVALPCLTVWALLGRGAARLLASPRAIRCFNQGMALLLVTSAWISVLS